MVTGVGFEPTPPERLVPKTSALDHSATVSLLLIKAYSQAPLVGLEPTIPPLGGACLSH